MQTHVKNIFTSKQRVYKLQDLLGTCKANNLELIIFKNIIYEKPERPINKARLHCSDTRYPIVLANLNGKYHILDGNHRYLKMRLENKTACIAFVVSSKNFEQLTESWAEFPDTISSCGGCAE